MKNKEYRVYLIDINKYTGSWFELSDKNWIEISEAQGNVYSLEGFSTAFNNEEVSDLNVLKILEVK